MGIWCPAKVNPPHSPSTSHWQVQKDYLETKGSKLLFRRPLVIPLRGSYSSAGEQDLGTQLQPFTKQAKATCRSRPGFSAVYQMVWCGCCGLLGDTVELLTLCNFVMLVPPGEFCGVTLIGACRGENQPQRVCSFSFLSITSSQPCLDGLELEGYVKVLRTSQRKICLWRIEKVGSREYVSVNNLFSHWVPMLAHIW